MSDDYGLRCKDCDIGHAWWVRGWDKAQELYDNFPTHWLIQQISAKWDDSEFKVQVENNDGYTWSQGDYEHALQFVTNHYGHDVCVCVYNAPLDTAVYGYPLKVNHLFREALAAERFDDAITQALIEAELFENGRYHKAVLMEIKGESNAK